MNDKWRKYQETSRVFRPIVICVKCGSTYIDHKPAGRLRRCDCENQAHWSPDRFRLVRDSRFINDEKEMKEFLERTGQDWISGMSGAEEMSRRETADDFAWDADLVKAVEGFLEQLQQVQIDAHTEDGRRYNSAEVQKLFKAFRDMSDKMEATLTSLLDETGG